MERYRCTVKYLRYYVADSPINRLEYRIEGLLKPLLIYIFEYVFKIFYPRFDRL